MGVGSLKKDGTTISHPRDKANILNMQFQSVFTRDNSDAQDIFTMSSPFATIDDIQITRAGIKRMLDQIKIHKAPGPDGITPRVMKELSEPVASILTIIFKKSYESGEIQTTGNVPTSHLSTRKAPNMIQVTTGLSPSRAYQAN